MILITGGLGFIGGNFIKYCLKNNELDDEFIIIDARYLGEWNDLVLEEIKSLKKGVIKFFPINSGDVTPETLEEYKVDTIINFAAYSHVDESITSPGLFIQNNIVQHYNLLYACQQYGKITRFLQMSTDEVYGHLEKEDKSSFKETAILNPRNIYSASKASAEMLCNAYLNTFKMPIVTVRSCNNFGPLQHPSKFIPKIMINGINNIPIPVYGEGNQIREWIYVEDACKAIINVLTNGAIGEVYNIGSGAGNCALENIELLNLIKDNFMPNLQIEFVKDRLGHDFKYSLDTSKFEGKFGVKYNKFNDRGLRKTFDFYKKYTKSK
jgi:dTDP-glucose 4,6-dehydratase